MTEGQYQEGLQDAPAPMQVMRRDQPVSVMSFENRMRLAEMLVTTNFLPPSIRTPAQAVAVIQTGHELGIPPMQALRSIAVIQNKPTLSSELQLGLFKRAGGRSDWRESTNTVATLWLRHPNGDEHTETYTLDDAKLAGLLSKDNWKKYPKSMLRARTVSMGLRAIAPDILAGIYNPDELGAIETPDGEVVTLPEKMVNASDVELTEYLANLVSVPVFSATERDAYRKRAESGESLTMLINEALGEGKRRGATPMQESVTAEQTTTT